MPAVKKSISNLAAPRGGAGKSDAKFRSQFKKTEICCFFARGWCSKGDGCEFAHGEEELQSAPDLTKTSLCKKWLKFQCHLSSAKCPFAHGAQELRSTEVYRGAARGGEETPTTKKSAAQKGTSRGSAYKQDQGAFFAEEEDHEKQVAADPAQPPPALASSPQAQQNPSDNGSSPEFVPPPPGRWIMEEVPATQPQWQYTGGAGDRVPPPLLPPQCAQPYAQCVVVPEPACWQQWGVDQSPTGMTVSTPMTQQMEMLKAMALAKGQVPSPETMVAMLQEATPEFYED